MYLCEQTLVEWMNEIEMVWWIENIWTMRSPFSKPQSLLVMDSFSAHITDSAKQHLIEQKTNMAIIPGGLTGRLQPLDSSKGNINKTHMVIAFVMSLLSLTLFLLN